MQQSRVNFFLHSLTRRPSGPSSRVPPPCERVKSLHCWQLVTAFCDLAACPRNWGYLAAPVCLPSLKCRTYHTNRHATGNLCMRKRPPRQKTRGRRMMHEALAELAMANKTMCRERKTRTRDLPDMRKGEGVADEKAKS